MLLLILAFVGGLLTILSPCILPVLPFVFARVGQPFARSGLPLLVGMAMTFAAVGLLAVVGGGWTVRANQAGRTAALLLLVVFALAMLFPSLAERWSRPLARLGEYLSRRSERARAAGSRVGSSALLGVAAGLLWAPCAGPILGLVFTGAAIRGATTQTALLLLAYAVGAATSLALALLASGRVAVALQRSSIAAIWLRRGLGGAVLASVGTIALGLDQSLLAGISWASTDRLEQALLARVQPARPDDERIAAASGLPVLGTLPPFPKGVVWLNSPPLSRDQVWGKVVLVNIWTYSCINCVRTLPHVRAWARKYKDHGLVVIGVHTPEFAFEKDLVNVREAMRKLGVTYPVVIDNDFAIWKAFNNHYWPAFYFIDGQGRIRATKVGEGAYDTSERTIQGLLREAGFRTVPGGLVQP
jgi:cytochrome c biogenesis protein CcdA/thiol-disulfide isomerase/thioredoxin